MLKLKPLKVWKRWIKMKTLNWQQIALALRDLGGSSERTVARMRLWIAVTKLNFLSVHEMLEELIRYPPY